MVMIIKDKETGLNNNVRKIAIAGLLAAMTVLTTVFTRIPVSIANGYFNLGDTIILAAGVLFGGFTGSFAGAAGSVVADILTGAYLFAPITLIVKGAEGFAAGILSRGIANRLSASPAQRRLHDRKLMPALVIGASVMVVGYFLAEATVLALFDSAFGIATAVAELPFNLIQGGASIILARLAIEGFKRTKIL